MKLFDKRKISFLSKYLLSLIILFLMLFLFFYLNNNLRAQNQSSIKLYVYPEANYNSLGDKVEVGTNSQLGSDIFEKFYNIPPTITVLDKSFYQLEIPATSGINLIFTRLDPNRRKTSFSNKSCSELNGRIENDKCIIEGMFVLTNQQSSYELWEISASSTQSNLGNIFFYLVPTSTALGDNTTKTDQYYILPTATSVTLTDNQPSATITYSIYYKKLYCPTSSLANATSVIQPPSNGFGSFSFNNDAFGNNIFITRMLNVNNNASSGIYTLFLIKRGDTNRKQISYNSSTIIVNNNITPPTLSLSCDVNPTSSLQIGSSSRYTLIASSSQTIYNATFTLKIATSGGLYKFISATATGNNNSLSYSTSIKWTATGTYYATATVEALNTSTKAICSAVNVGTCSCLYRQSQQDEWERSCQNDDGTWSNWEPYYGDIDENCNCGNDNVRRNYPQCGS